MTEISFSQNLGQILFKWQPISLTTSALRQARPLWQHPAPTDEQQSSTSQSSNNNDPQPAPLSSPPNSEPQNGAPASPQPNPSPPTTNTPVYKPLSEKSIEALMRGGMTYALLPYIGYAGILYNVSLCTTKTLVAVVVSSYDKELAKKLGNDALMHGVLLVNDFVVGHFIFIAATGMALDPDRLIDYLEWFFQKPAGQDNSSPPKQPPDTRAILEKLTQTFLAAATGDAKEGAWYIRLWHSWSQPQKV